MGGLYGDPFAVGGSLFSFLIVMEDIIGIRR